MIKKRFQILGYFILFSIIFYSICYKWIFGEIFKLGLPYGLDQFAIATSIFVYGSISYSIMLITIAVIGFLVFNKKKKEELLKGYKMSLYYSVIILILFMSFYFLYYY